MKNIKVLLYSLIALSAFVLVPMTSCNDWTETEALDLVYEKHPESYYQSLKDYFASPHQKMFGWFGSWTAGSKGNSLVGLPDSTDFVSLWLIWGNLTEAQQADLKAFQERGSKAVLCWRAGDIGDNLTPNGNDDAEKEAFWGFSPDDEASLIAAAQKYAMAIVDTCEKYGINGFDYDIEDSGTLMNSKYRTVPNAFMRTLREEFTKRDMLLVADIPGGIGWLSYYDMLDEDVAASLDYLVWQTYELDHYGLDNFFDAVERKKPAIFENVLAKSIITATFERAADKHLFHDSMESYHHYRGLPHGGMGAYHIEYDYPGNPDYPTVRAAISAQNPPIRK